MGPDEAIRGPQLSPGRGKGLTSAVHPDGTPVIPSTSHVRLSTPGPGEEMLRRGYSYRGAVLPDGTTDQGLL